MEIINVYRILTAQFYSRYEENTKLECSTSLGKENKIDQSTESCSTFGFTNMKSGI